MSSKNLAYRHTQLLNHLSENGQVLSKTVIDLADMSASWNPAFKKLHEAAYLLWIADFRQQYPDGIRTKTVSWGDLHAEVYVGIDAQADLEFVRVVVEVFIHPADSSRGHWQEVYSKTVTESDPTDTEKN